MYLQLQFKFIIYYIFALESGKIKKKQKIKNENHCHEVFSGDCAAGTGQLNITDNRLGLCVLTDGLEIQYIYTHLN